MSEMLAAATTISEELSFVKEHVVMARSAEAVSQVIKAYDIRGRVSDGMTVDLGDGSWFNLRSSNTEPLLRLNVEARSVEDVERIVGQIAAEINSLAREAS
jgi:phosphomannomutase